MGRMEAVVEMALAELVASLGYELAVLAPSRLWWYIAALGTALGTVVVGIAVVGIAVVQTVLGIAVVPAVVGIAVVLAVVGIAVVLAQVLELAPVADN